MQKRVLFILNKDELLFHSELNIVSVSDANKIMKPFTLKFTGITKYELKYYKSKEAYHRLVDPTMRLLITNIVSCNVIVIDQSIFKKDKALKYYFFYVKYLFNEDKYETKSISSTSSNYDNSSNKYNSRVVNLNEENKRIKGKKIQLISNNTNNKISSQATGTDNTELLSDLRSTARDIGFDFTNTIVFASISKDLVDKWVCVVNHLIKK